MPTTNRLYGASHGLPATYADLSVKAVYGQYVTLNSVQAEPLSINESGKNILETSSLDELAQKLNVATTGKTKEIVFNYTRETWTFQDGSTGYVISGFNCNITLQVLNTTANGISAQDILNALTGSWLEYLQTGPFTHKAFIAGTQITVYYCRLDFQTFSTEAELNAHMLAVHGQTPPPGEYEQPENPTVATFKHWLFHQPGREYADVAKDQVDMNEKYYMFNQFPVTWESYFQTQDRSAFSPLSSTPATLDNALMLTLLAVVLRKPDGLKTLERLAVKYLDSASDILNGIQNSSKAHPLTAMNNATIYAAVAHRLGMIDDGGYLKIVEQSRHAMDNIVALATADKVLVGLDTLVEGDRKTRKTVTNAIKDIDFAKLMGLMK